MDSSAEGKSLGESKEGLTESDQLRIRKLAEGVNTGESVLRKLEQLSLSEVTYLIGRGATTNYPKIKDSFRKALILMIQKDINIQSIISAYIEAEKGRYGRQSGFVWEAVLASGEEGLANLKKYNGEEAIDRDHARVTLKMIRTIERKGVNRLEKKNTLPVDTRLMIRKRIQDVNIGSMEASAFKNYIQAFEASPALISYLISQMQYFGHTKEYSLRPAVGNMA